MAVSLDEVIGQILDVLREAFEGPRERWSYFTDNNSDAGLFGTLAAIRAEDASRITGATSIAAHVHHTIFALEASTDWIDGDRSPRNWKESWSVSTVGATAWQDLLIRLRTAYQDLRRAIEEQAVSTTDAMGGAIGALAHAAYHLGAIRQKISLGRR
jgi:hypothetical protein